MLQYIKKIINLLAELVYEVEANVKKNTNAYSLKDTRYS
jgi:hypothetical protein